MKLTFEGKTFGDVLDQMRDVLDGTAKPKASMVEPRPAPLTAATTFPPQGPGPDVFAERSTPVDKPVNKPVNKPVSKPGRTPKQLENDERLRVAAKAKMEAKRAAKAQVTTALETPLPPPLATATAEGMDPAEVVRVRQKTITDLQEAYANGRQEEVFELLSRFGNGAKSFRELPPESFVPIRQAIDLGALEGHAPK